MDVYLVVLFVCLFVFFFLFWFWKLLNIPVLVNTLVVCYWNFIAEISRVVFLVTVICFIWLYWPIEFFNYELTCYWSKMSFSAYIFFSCSNFPCCYWSSDFDCIMFWRYIEVVHFLLLYEYLLLTGLCQLFCFFLLCISHFI